MDVTEVDSELENIINGCLENNRLSQRRLYDRYASRMFGICRRFANSDEEAEDMLMEGFMQIFKGLETFKGDSSFLTWMHSVMVKSAISHYRSIRRFRNEQFVGTFGDDFEFGEEETITTMVEARLVVDKLQRMPENLRVVFNLRAVENFSFTEISDMLGKKENAVRIAYMRARQWMLKELEVSS